MVHRGLREPRYRWWVPLVFVVVAGAAFSALFIVGDLLIYGHVNW